MLDTEINSKCLDLLRPHPVHPTPSSPFPIIPFFSIFLYVDGWVTALCQIVFPVACPSMVFPRRPGHLCSCPWGSTDSQPTGCTLESPENLKYTHAEAPPQAWQSQEILCASHDEDIP